MLCLLSVLIMISLILLLYYSGLPFGADYPKPDSISKWLNSSLSGKTFLIITVSMLSIGTGLMAKAKRYGTYISIIAFTTAIMIFPAILVYILPDKKGDMDCC